MSKYVIKNCPCYIDMPLYHHDKVCQLGDKVKPNHKELYVYCKDCTDCKMKQIYDLCNHYKDVDIVALQVAQLLQIEEVE